ncbi:MAG: FAD-dependent oxidoreductase [Candidatus Syntrophoarchaeum sp.]|nr:FAD-dependent oxidoreductase [Candidatus Syntrophoarchaeum sp.]
MNATDILVVGGSAGGPIAAISARRNYPDKKITVIRREEKVLVPCGIPYIFGSIGSPEKNLIPYDVLFPKNDIDLVIDEVTAIDTDSKQVNTATSGVFGYEKLVMATGSQPVVPPIPGVDLENVFFAKKDIAYLNNFLKVLEGAEDIVIIGGGFIGVEFADEIRKRGVNVSIVEMLTYCLGLAYSDDFCQKVEEKLKERGINIYTNVGAKTILGDKRVNSVELSNGEKLKADVVLLGIGARPEVELAKAAGLEIGPTGAIAVDTYMRASAKDVFAVGDCAEKRSFFTGEPSLLRLASIAGMEARIAGANLYEIRQKNDGVIGTFSTIVGDLALGVAGLNEKSATDAGIDFVQAEVTTTDKHPGSMPDTHEMHLKMLFSKTGEIIGGEVYGGHSTAEFTNIIASMIQQKLRVWDIIKFQMTTQPALTASPVVYPIVNVAEIAMTML